jgi:hypothetical protein
VEESGEHVKLDAPGAVLCVGKSVAGTALGFERSTNSS